MVSNFTERKNAFTDKTTKGIIYERFYFNKDKNGTLSVDFSGYFNNLHEAYKDGRISDDEMAYVLTDILTYAKFTPEEYDRLEKILTSKRYIYSFDQNATDLTSFNELVLEGDGEKTTIKWRDGLQFLLSTYLTWEGKLRHDFSILSTPEADVVKSAIKKEHEAICSERHKDIEKRKSEKEAKLSKTVSSENVLKSNSVTKMASPKVIEAKKKSEDKQKLSKPQTKTKSQNEPLENIDEKSHEYYSLKASAIRKNKNQNQLKIDDLLNGSAKQHESFK